MVESFSIAHVEEKIGIPRLTLYRIKKTTRGRGFAPKQDPRVLEAYIVDRERRGRPKTIIEVVEQRLLTNVREDRSSREKSSEVLAYEVGISRRSALRILKKYGLTNVKPTRKPGLTDRIRANKLRFYLEHRH